ncbi:hypothetical protein MCFN_01215 [Mycoplasmopsis californica]|uniref:Septation ring formation regulator n=1 Tax=Mycoplasmopsis californica TaxID=2113 RepID=A0A059XVN5_9BACT|nr:hypothetical protein [Mycoplasmopsis californica]AIA29391.1 hypothetical protein MCFN_01215 [Mycoplasmopsis californica]
MIKLATNPQLTNKSNGTNPTMIALLCIVVFLCLLLNCLFIFLLFRKNKLTRCANDVKKLKDYIYLNNHENQSTLKRLESISKTNNSMIENQQKIDNLMNQMRKTCEILSPLIREFNEATRKTQLHKVNNLYPQIKKYFNNYKKCNSEFKSMSDLLNSHWNAIEISVMNTYEVLKVLEDTLRESKEQYNLSYTRLHKELISLRSKTQELEKQRESKNIQDVSGKLNDHDHRVRTFASRVSHMPIIEWLSHHYMPQLLNDLKKIEPNANLISDMDARLIKIQNNLFNSAFQFTLTDMRTWLRDHAIAKRNHNLRVQIHKYAQKSLSIIEKSIQKSNLALQELEQKYSIQQSGDITTLQSRLQNLNADFNTIKNNAVGQEMISLLSIDALNESLINWVYQYNDIVKQINQQQFSMSYYRYYLEILEIWYISIINERHIVEQSSENEKIFNELIEKQQKMWQKDRKNISIYLTEFIEKLQQSYRIITKAKTYKYMSSELIKSILVYRIDNPTIDAIIDRANEYLGTKHYEKAFKIITDLIKKERLNVHKNFN